MAQLYLGETSRNVLRNIATAWMNFMPGHDPGSVFRSSSNTHHARLGRWNGDVWLWAHTITDVSMMTTLTDVLCTAAADEGPLWGGGLLANLTPFSGNTKFLPTYEAQVEIPADVFLGWKQCSMTLDALELLIQEGARHQGFDTRIPVMWRPSEEGWRYGHQGDGAIWIGESEWVEGFMDAFKQIPSDLVVTDPIIVDGMAYTEYILAPAATSIELEYADPEHDEGCEVA